MEITRFKTPKGKDAFSLDGYCFRVDKRSADGERVFWQCLDPSCTVRMETVGTVFHYNLCIILIPIFRVKKTYPNNENNWYKSVALKGVALT